ncbi:MAG TPA: 4-(cytidine 5'-diphospho)-2-C-methyl-D-erythritol kinase [Propylenella sp.]
MPRAVAALLAPAKINLALHVTGRRADGYHLLDTIAVFADVGDRIEIVADDRRGLALSGPFAGDAPADDANLARRAADAFAAACRGEPSVSIRVEKNLPAGAGLGGGSADAAAVLLGLTRLLRRGAPPPDLMAIGLALGADVPMCLAGHALRAQGIGEQIEPLANWPELPLVLIWPGRALSTAAVFAALPRKANPPLAEPWPAATAAEAAAWLGDCRNDLEAPALALAPEIGDVLHALRGSSGCLLARMSGSGSACFGLYGERSAAEAAAAAIRRRRPDWWIAATLAS